MTISTQVAVWTPSLGEVNGQNNVTRGFIQMLRGQCDVREYPTAKAGMLRALGAGFMFFCRYGLVNREAAVYLVVSRSVTGAIRDCFPLALSLIRTKVVCHVHGSDLSDLLQNKLIGWLMMLLYRRCRVIIPSVHLLDDLIKLGLRDVVVCENFVRQEGLSMMNAEHDGKQLLMADNFNIVWNSNILSTKGIFELCDAVVTVAKRHPKVRLVVFGAPVSDEEMLAEEVAKKIKSYESKNEIVFCGSVSEAEMSLHVAQSDLVALLSTYKSECQPLSVIMAMALNRNLLLTDTAALRATVGSYEDVTYTARSTDDIVNSLDRILAQKLPRKARGSDINAAVFNRFSPDRFMKTITEVINDW